MVKPLRKTIGLQPAKLPKRRIKWWRGLLGAVLTALIIVPFMMGMDAEKYLRTWIQATNQQNGKVHLELVHYKRHWFTSDGDIIFTGTPVSSSSLSTPLTMHIKTYHGPLLLNGLFNGFNGIHPRLGLALIKGSIDTNQFFAPQAAIQLNGATELTAFIPYFSDREVQTTLPAVTITDKANNFIYTIPSLSGSFDGDSLIQLEIPSFKISKLDGTSVADFNTGLLRILPDNHSSFSVKNIHIYREKNDAAVISNLLIEADAVSSGSDIGLNIAMRFDNLDPSLADPSLPLGPLEFKFKINGLHKDGLNAFMEYLKILGLQKNTLTPEEAANLILAISHTVSIHTNFDLDANLKTQEGPLITQFHGGFTDKNIQQSSDLMDAFYTQGIIKLSADMMHAIADYKSKDLTFMLDLLKPDGQDYSATVDMRDGKITMNGQNVKEEAAHP